LSEPTASYVRAASADCYLLGYWQSESYFAAAAEQVRRDFRFVPELSGDNRSWARRILDCMAVSLHIRRGDYASDVQTQAAHDMRLISLCRHHIIANSSFSWWGAWLCEHAGKMVVAPARWLAEVLLPDVVPAYWVRL